MRWRSSPRRTGPRLDAAGLSQHPVQPGLHPQPVDHDEIGPLKLPALSRSELEIVASTPAASRFDLRQIPGDTGGEAIDRENAGQDVEFPRSRGGRRAAGGNQAKHQGQEDQSHGGNLGTPPVRCK